MKKYKAKFNDFVIEFNLDKGWLLPEIKNLIFLMGGFIEENKINTDIGYDKQVVYYIDFSSYNIGHKLEFIDKKTAFLFNGSLSLEVVALENKPK